MCLLSESEICGQAPVFTDVKTLSKIDKISVAGICHSLLHILQAMPVQLMAVEVSPRHVGLSGAFIHMSSKALLQSSRSCDKLDHGTDAVRIQRPVYKRASAVIQ